VVGIAVRSATDNPNLLDSSLLQNAVSFAAAADAYIAMDGGRDWFPLYFLIGQSAELALKAFIISKGASEAELKKIGHSLVRALERAGSAGMDVTALLTDDERGAIKILSKLHGQQVTRYPLLQGYLIPRPIILRRLLEKLITSAYIEIWDRGIFEHDRSRGRIGLAFDPMVYSATGT
jgi:hypothetical protein